MAVMDYVRLYSSKWKESWGKLEARQKIIFSAIGAMILIGFVVLITSFGPGEAGYKALEVPVSNPQAAVRKLMQYGIEARHDMESGSIKVPQDLEQRSALILTSFGMLPDGRNRYAFLKESNLTQTDSRMRQTLLKEQQEIIADTLSALPFISQAEVILTPAAEPFNYQLSSPDILAKAAVTVELIDQLRLTEEQVASICELVGGSWETLDPERVRLMDFTGTPYVYTKDWRSAITVQTHKERYERNWKRKIEDLLMPYGAHAEVEVVIDPTKSRLETRTLTGPAKPTYEETSEEQSEGTTKAGTTGVEMDVQRDRINDPGRRELQEKRSMEMGLTKYDYDVASERKDQTTPFKIDYSESSITVRLSDKHKDQLTAEKIAEIQRAVETATHVSAGNVSITIAPDSAMAGIGGGMGGGAGGMVDSLLSETNIVRALLLLLGIGSVIGLMIMVKKSAPEPLSLVDEEYADDSPEPMPEVPRLPPVEQLEGNLVREKVVDLIKKNPVAAANLVKRWMIMGK